MTIASMKDGAAEQPGRDLVQIDPRLGDLSEWAEPLPPAPTPLLRSGSVPKPSEAVSVIESEFDAEDPVRDRIIRAGLDDLIAGRLPNRSMASFATDLRISTKTLYKQIDSRAGLVLAIVDEVLESVERRAARLLAAQSPSPGLRLRRLVAGLFVLTARFRNADANELGRGTRGIREQIDLRRRAFLQRVLTPWLPEVATADEFRPGVDPELWMQTLLLVAERVLTPESLRQYDRTPGEMYCGTLGVLLEGGLRSLQD